MRVSGTGWIDEVYVSREKREQYWGSALVDALCEALNALGAQEIRLAAPPHNHLAQAFLNGLGWRPVEQIFEHGAWPTFQTLLGEVRIGSRRSKQRTSGP